MLKRPLRRFLLWSAVPPLDAVHRLGYRLAVRGATLALRGRPGLEALYLCRGCAKGEILPGVSDIDLVLVTAGSGAEREALVRVFARMRALTFGLVDAYPSLVVPRATLEHRWRTAPSWQHRIGEGRSTWRLLAGADVLGDLPPLAEAQGRSAAYLEVARWWLHFADRLLATREHHDDAVVLNVTCFKAVSETLNALHAMRTGERRPSRAAGLAASDAPLARRLEAVAARRFLGDEAGLADETCRFLVTTLTGLWEGFREAPFLQVAPGVVQSLDAPEAETAAGEAHARHLATIRAHLERRWSGICTGTRLVRSTLWGLNELLLIVEAEAGRLPTVSQMADLVAAHRRDAAGLPAPLHLFLRVGPVAFPLAPVLPRDLHRGVPAPGTAPDVFLQLGHAEVYWTDYTDWYLRQWRTNEQWDAADERKKAQLRIIAAGAARGRVVYPLTAAALGRQAGGAAAG
jgi:hypothetical protein